MRPGLGPKGITIALDVILVVVALAAPALAYVTIGPGREAEPRVVEPLPDLQLILATCASIVNDLQHQECLLDGLRPVLLTHGLGTTFALLEQLTQIDPYSFKFAHPLAHMLGGTAAVLLGDKSVDAIAECPFTMASGCVHGVLETHLRSIPSLRLKQVAGLCSGAERAGQHAHFQCLHGLGHGLTMYHRHAWQVALEFCDALGNSWQRESCYGGVFMENLVSYGVAKGISPGEGSVHTHTDEKGEQHYGLLKPEDLQYPCNATKHQYKNACWTIHTSGILILTGYNRRVAFDECLQAETEFIPICFHSMGRDASSIANWDPAGIVRICDEGSADYRGWCYVGAVKDLVNTLVTSEYGLQLCRLAPEENKDTCYRGLGEIMVPVYPDPGERASQCERAEAEYVVVCRQAALL